MNKQTLLALSLLLVALSQAVAWPAYAEGAKPRAKPNIIIIYTDDHGYTDLGVHGIDKNVDTPNLDKLARGGAYMTAGYSSSPQCQPSRAGLMLGRIQNEAGFSRNAIDAGAGKSVMPLVYPKGTDMAGQPVLTIADRMRKLGYVTGMSGKWHLGKTYDPEAKTDPRGRGFDFYWAGPMNAGATNMTLDGKPCDFEARKDLPKGIPNRVILQGKYGESFIQIAKDKDKPFLLYLPLYGPHVPLLERDDPYYTRFPKLNYPHYTDWHNDRRRMGLALIKAIDDAVGGVMTKLRELGIEDNTLILFAGDNGAPLKLQQHKGMPGGEEGQRGGAWNGSHNIPMRGEKASLFEGGIRVPMLVYWKGVVRPGQVVKEMVTTLDLTATTLAAGGGAIPKEFDGVDLMPHLTGKAATLKRTQPMFWDFWECDAVRHGDWKLWRSSVGNLLFNIAQDPYELTNLIDKRPDKAAELTKLLEAWHRSLPEPARAAFARRPIFYWPLLGAPEGVPADPRYLVPYKSGKPTPYPAPIAGSPVKPNTRPIKTTKPDKPNTKPDKTDKPDKPATKEPDLKTPPMTTGDPAPGKRVRQVAAKYKGTDVYHTLYLPTDWRKGKTYPVLVEYTGNQFPPGKGSGEVKDANLGYGLSAGKGFIWITMPCIAKDGKSNVTRWWGDRQATIDYCKTNLPLILKEFGGDPANVFICGFSRGAIACSYIGLADDGIAAFWKGVITHDHFDGQRQWGYPEDDRKSALKRLARLKGRPVLVCGGGNDFLKQHPKLADFTFLPVQVKQIYKIPEPPVYHHHTDLWLHRASKTRDQARKWLAEKTKVD